MNPCQAIGKVVFPRKFQMKQIAAILVLFVLAGCASPPLRLNEPIFLRPGEAEAVGPDGFEITLRSISEDISPTDCSTMIFRGSIGVRLGDKNKVIKTGAIMKPGQVVPMQIEGYQFQLTGIKQTSPNQIQARFIVLGPKKR